MKIYIANISNTYNYGSMMMAEVLINYLHSNISNVSFYIDAKTNDHTNRLKEATGVNEIYIDNLYNVKFSNSENPLKRLYCKIMRDTKLFFSFNVRKCRYDAIIILGGDDYSEIYFNIPSQSRTVINHLNKLKKYNKCSKLFMVGQTLGPYTGKRLEIAKKVLKDINIYSRDEVSRTYLKEKIGKEAFEMRDLAFMPLNLEKEYLLNKTNILSEYGLVEKEYVTVIGSGLYNCYTEDEENFNDTFIQILKTLKAKYVNKKILLLAHVTNKKTCYSDIAFIERIKKQLPEGIVVIIDTMLPAKARIILGAGYLTVSYRMHAAVSTFYMGTPAICVSYSPKYMGVIGKGLNQEELIIKSTKATFNKDKIILALIDKLEIVEQNYDEINRAVKVKIDNANKITKKALKDIIVKIKE